MADSDNASNFDKTTQNSVRRLRERGHYDKATIYSIIDECLIAHVGFIETAEDGKQYPVGMPAFDLAALG